MTTVAIGTPRVTYHLEAETEDCICVKIRGCGGVENFKGDCPEHGAHVPLVRYHTHSVQVRRKAVGTHWR